MTKKKTGSYKEEVNRLNIWVWLWGIAFFILFAMTVLMANFNLGVFADEQSQAPAFSPVPTCDEWGDRIIFVRVINFSIGDDGVASGSAETIKEGQILKCLGNLYDEDGDGIVTLYDEDGDGIVTCEIYDVQKTCTHYTQVNLSQTRDEMKSCECVEWDDDILQTKKWQKCADAEGFINSYCRDEEILKACTLRNCTIASQSWLEERR